MSEAIITVENLGKRYKIRHQQQGRRYVALRDVLAEKAKGLFQISKFRKQKIEIKNESQLSALPISTLPSREDFWALKDVSFEVKRGEVVGIIGRNGAGKSTLLKILSRITEPTEGEVRLRGRVASLLEVGTGFHPELTGRENIFLNGAILGMSKAEIRRRFDEIVTFAEVEKFLDTPVKRYSSGMYVRLAFSVAAHLEPDILIVDEVLAVGDAEFQKKCLGKMKDVSTTSGRTVLFVSHNMTAIHQLCQRCILLGAGRVTSDAAPETTLTLYLRAVNESEVSFDAGPLRHASVRQVDQGIRIDAKYDFSSAVNIPSLGIVIKNYLGSVIFGANPQTSGINQLGKPSARGAISVLIRQPRLRSGQYVVSLWLGDGVRDYVALADAITLNVVNVLDGKSTFSHENVGSVYPVCEWSFLPTE